MFAIHWPSRCVHQGFVLFVQPIYKASARRLKFSDGAPILHPVQEKVDVEVFVCWLRFEIFDPFRIDEWGARSVPLLLLCVCV